MSPFSADTIAAIATAPGRGGIGIVRVSGRGCRSIAETLLGRVPQPRAAELHRFLDAAGDAIDEGLALFFPAPASFTGEDVLELHGHGGPVVMDLLLRRTLELGARAAEPGEFTQRAFLNDKLDLAQAEAVADLIDSGSAQAARAALRSLAGEFSSQGCGDLPPSFQPQLPWFRQLDGHPPYEALKRELERRIERIRDELLRIEKDAALGTAQPTPQASSGSGRP